VKSHNLCDDVVLTMREGFGGQWVSFECAPVEHSSIGLACADDISSMEFDKRIFG
jgi:hypothetical protein